MPNIKEKMVKIIKSQPDDASFEEIIRQLVFERMVEKGLDDSRRGKLISNKEMGSRIESWQK